MNEAIMIEVNIAATYEQIPIIEGCIRTILSNVGDAPAHNNLRYGVELAVHEVCTNIVEHAYAGAPGRIRAALTLEPQRRLVVDLYDNGRSFNATAVAEPNLDEPQTSGYGLFLVRNLMDEVTYRPHADGNHWRLIKEL